MRLHPAPLLLLWAALGTAGCDVRVSLGTPPDAGPPVPADCVPVDTTGESSFGTLVLGRSAATTVTVTNCSRQPVAFSARLETAGSAISLDRANATQPNGTVLGPLEQAALTVRFVPRMAVASLAVLEVMLGGQRHQVTFTGAAVEHPQPPRRLDCTVLPTVTVEGSLVFGPETTPDNPDVVLALHGLTRDQCLDVTGDVVVMGTSLGSLEVLGGLRVVRGRLLLGHEWAGNALLRNVDALGNLLRVDGDLTVRGNPRLGSLDGLVGLTRVGGTLTVHSNPLITDLAGLHNLSTLGGGLVLESNQALRQLDALSQVHVVPGPLRVVGNKVLSNLDGLAGITAVDGELAISFNDVLKSLGGLRSLTSVGPYVGIQGNAALQDVDGLAGVTTARELVVAQNPSLRTMDGLSGITRVTQLVVSHHAALQSLAGLSKLAQVDRHLIIQSNAQLRRLGLDALTRVGGLLTIRNNPQLPTQEARALSQRAGGTADIQGNAP